MSENSELFAAALAHHQSGELGEARALYGQVLQRDPGHADALHFLGLLACQLGQHDAGLALMGQSIEAHPNAIYYNNLGNMLCERGRLAEAIEGYREAVRLQPDYPEAHNNLGHALREAKQAQASMRSCAQAIALRPGYAEAYNNLGNALQDMGELEAAASSYERAIGLRADYAEAHNNLGNVLRTQGRAEEAIARYRTAVELKPALRTAHHSLGLLLRERGEQTAALESLRKALDPADANAHNSLGIALRDMGDLDAALTHLETAIAINPRFAEAHHHHAVVLLTRERAAEALVSCRTALSLVDDDASMYTTLGEILRAMSDFSGAIAAYRKSLTIDPDLDNAHQGLIFSLASSAHSSPSGLLADARRYGTLLAGRARPYRHTATRAEGPLRVGFVSGDLKAHPVAAFLESVLADLDPNRVEPIAYATQPVEDAMTTWLKPHFAVWRDITGMSDETVASAIHRDGIHILIDLSGYTSHNRLGVFAWKPAPVQASWIGYFATTGIEAVDYVIGDRYVLPPEEEHQFVERPWRMPDSYVCFTPPRPEIAVGPLPMLENGQVTFGCLNNIAKIGDDVVALWARVLHAVPNSRLLLKAPQLGQLALRSAITERFRGHDIAATRLVLLGGSTRNAHLDTYNEVDIALNPFPYPGGTTSAEGLWMGVPVLTRRGDRFLSRVGESILNAAGLPEWIADGDEDYVSKAVAFAADRERLAALRARLRSQVIASPLCNSSRFARHLEDAFESMWNIYAVSAATG